MRKFISIIGILASLSAAEGLNRFGGFVSAMGGKDATFYMVILAIAVIVAIFLYLQCLVNFHVL